MFKYKKTDWVNSFHPLLRGYILCKCEPKDSDKHFDSLLNSINNYLDYEIVYMKWQTPNMQYSGYPEKYSYMEEIDIYTLCEKYLKSHQSNILMNIICEKKLEVKIKSELLLIKVNHVKSARNV